MSLLKKVAQNTALQVLGKIVGTALGFFTAIFLLRYLGDTQFGYYTTALTYLQLFGIAMDLGLYIALLRGISNGKEQANQALINNIFTLRAMAAVVFLGTACALVWFIPQYPQIIRLGVLIVAANYFFISMNQLLLGVYQKELATGIVAVAEVCGKIVLFIASLLAIFIWQSSLLWLLAVVTLSGAVNFSILWWHVRRYTHIRPAFDLAIVKQLFHDSWPTAVSITLNLIYLKADTIILGLFRSQTEVGIYGTPYKILEVIISLPAMLVGLTIPMIGAAFNAQHLPEFKQLYQRTFNVLVILLIPLVIGAQLVAQPLMLIVAGEDFTSQPQDLGYLLQILILAVGAIFIGTLTGYVMPIINKQRSMLWGYGFVALTAFLGYIIFIPQYSYYGAAWVTVYSETMMMLIGVWLIHRATGVWPEFVTTSKVLLAGIIMAMAVWLTQSADLWWQIIVAVITYGCALIIVGAVQKSDLVALLKRTPSN